MGAYLVVSEKRGRAGEAELRLTRPLQRYRTYPIHHPETIDASKLRLVLS